MARPRRRRPGGPVSMRRKGLLMFVVRRLAALVGVLVVMSFVIFLFLYLSPGSVEQTLLGPRELTPAAVAAIRHQYHLDQPFLVQYVDWVKGAVRFDFGHSILSNEAVTTIIGRRLTLSLQLAGLGRSNLAVVAAMRAEADGTESIRHVRMALIEDGLRDVRHRLHEGPDAVLDHRPVGAR